MKVSMAKCDYCGKEVEKVSDGEIVNEWLYRSVYDYHVGQTVMKRFCSNQCVLDFRLEGLEWRAANLERLTGYWDGGQIPLVGRQQKQPTPRPPAPKPGIIMRW